MKFTEAAHAFMDFIDDRIIVRRAVIFTTIWMTWQAFEWAKSYAALSPRPGTDIAIIIAAVMAPIAALQGFAFHSYTDDPPAQPPCDDLHDDNHDGQ